MDVRDSEILVSGYHRDVFSGGSLDDETKIFLIHSENPLSSDDWILQSGIIRDIDADPNQIDSLSVEFGHDQAHILYQTIRNDTTGKDRLGVWYSHGKIGQETWAYRKAVGDESALPILTVIEDDDDGDTLVSLWREGDPQDSELVVFVTDSNFMTKGGMEARIPARGMAGIGIVESERGMQVLFDRVGASGPQVEYGLIDVEDGWIGLSDALVRGQYKSMDRSEDSGETMMIVSSSDGWQIRTLIDDGGSRRGGSLSDQLRSSLGLDQESFEILVIGIALAVLILGMVTLVGLSAQGVRWMGRRGSVDKEANVVMEDDVVDIVRETDLSVGVEEVEIVQDSDEEVVESGRDSRRARRDRRNSGEDVLPGQEESGVIQPVLDIPMPDSPMAPTISGQIACPGCGSRFTAEPGAKSMKCPICGAGIGL